MEQFLWNVVDVFQISNRGVVITADVLECDECADVWSGATLQIRRPDGSRLDCAKFTVGMIDPPNRERPRHFFLSGVPDIRDVPIGSELWCVHNDGQPASWGPTN